MSWKATALRFFHLFTQLRLTKLHEVVQTHATRIRDLTGLPKQRARPSERHPAPPSFKHVPLDYSRPSIRLIRIASGLSVDGLIQCEMFHCFIGKIDYVCLSYTWGETQDQHEILIDGKLFQVSKNLWAFLRATRLRHLELKGLCNLPYWIDAVCIDQRNLRERNHQVAVMGRIYSRASCVIVWLGASRTIDRLFTNAAMGKDKKEFEPLFITDWWRMRRQQAFVEGRKGRQLAKDWTTLVTHPYWTRAWITQEVLLARQVLIATDTTQILGNDLRWIYDVRQVFLPQPEQSRTKRKTVSARIASRSTNYLDKITSPQAYLRHRNIFGLLEDFPGRASHLLRDRIYSIVDLASDGGLIPLDYGMSDNEFFYQLLRATKSSVRCFCSVEFLTKSLHYTTRTDEQGPRIQLSLQVPATFGARYSKIQLFCPGCSVRVYAQDSAIFCLQRHCTKMRGHLVLKKARAGSGGSQHYVLALRLDMNIHDIDLGVAAVNRLEWDGWIYNIRIRTDGFTRLTKEAFVASVRGDANFCSNHSKGTGCVKLISSDRGTGNLSPKRYTTRRVDSMALSASIGTP